jgi:hypothetical protein
MHKNLIKRIPFTKRNKNFKNFDCKKIGSSKYFSFSFNYRNGHKKEIKNQKEIISDALHLIFGNFFVKGR